MGKTPLDYIEIGSELFIGPFNINYPYDMVTYTAPNGKNYIGIYGEITKFTVNGKEIAQTNFYNQAGQKLDGSLTFNGYPGNNQPFYIKASEAGVKKEE